MIPLINRLKKNSHREIARAQDLIVEAVFSQFPEAVMHGGTAIWRCYRGNRFSEDVDVYFPGQNLEPLFEKLKQRGFLVRKRKVGEKSLYSELQLGDCSVRLEGLFSKKKGIIKEYETAEGIFLFINTLTPDELVVEKISAYLQRRKIRDLYDVFILWRLVQDKPKIKPYLDRLLQESLKPVDEPDLKVLILEGLVPTREKMVEYLTWENKNMSGK